MRKNAPKFFILAGGGSGGHLFPGLAVASALKKIDQFAQIIFLATERHIDSQILEPTGFKYTTQPIKPIPSIKKPTQIFKFFQSWRSSVRLCRNLMIQNPPQAVLGLGGFASGPALMVANKQLIPTALLNPDAVPGRANRFGRRFSKKIFLQWQASQQYFGPDAHKCVVTGCPVRDIISDNKYDKPLACKELGLDPEKQTLVIMGGSQGGHNLNQAAVECLTNGKIDHNNWQILHLTGKKDKTYAIEKYQAASITAQVWEFTDKMDKVLQAADLMIARAGASSLAEITIAGVPSILIPYPYHKDQHQLRNAEVLAQVGAAQIVTDQCDKIKTAQNLLKVLTECRDDKVLSAMSLAALSLAKEQAGATVAQELINLTVN
ncbi:MAG: UDP-N-acetylglucosamine--N-acetylmuramyl-(pentapeptide) pyrophosphoryl-undecaprenol N-acetylglucosamine transferase [Planctomycetes bacterium]|nr:UDP-N-acetylglucosamine--N-acetylmuramyl-(pentapeptide) pyrophosphoryl-undecaprenol N-acetylglucosamine transferase [Planctomycetota bacterium]